MKNKKITRKISQGMYVLTTCGGGCIVDAVSQISAGDNPLIAVAVMKSNYTNELMNKNDKFALSVLGVNVNPDIIKIFGFNSMRNINKFDNVSVMVVDNINVIDDSLGYMLCEKIDSIDNDTHTLFIGKLIEADLFNDSKEMTYGYYQEHKDELLKVTLSDGKIRWVCTVCGYVYEEEELPEDYRCPKCGVSRELFERK